MIHSLTRRQLLALSAGLAALAAFGVQAQTATDPAASPVGPVADFTMVRVASLKTSEPCILILCWFTEYSAE